MAARTGFVILLLLVGYSVGYLTGASKPPVERFHYLTGTVDPLLCLKGKRT